MFSTAGLFSQCQVSWQWQKWFGRHRADEHLLHCEKKYKFILKKVQHAFFDQCICTRMVLYGHIYLFIFVIAASFAVGDPNVGLDTIGKQCIQTQDPELVRTTVTNENLSSFNWSWSYKIWCLSCFRLPADKSSSSMQTMGNCGNGWVTKAITRIFLE